MPRHVVHVNISEAEQLAGHAIAVDNVRMVTP